jgi:hypothetical protein
MAPVKSEIHGEMVAGAHWDAGERDIPSHRNLGNDGEGTVTAGHDEVVASLDYEVGCQDGEVVAGLQGHGFNAQLLSSAEQTDGFGAAVATSQIHDQYWMAWHGIPLTDGTVRPPST